MFEDFSDASEEERVRIHKDFCSQIWNVPNKRETKTCYISFSVNSKLLKDEDLREVFRKYNRIPYITYRSFTSNQNSWYLLRQKINNLYSVMCDTNICLNKEYFRCLKFARQAYFEYINETCIDGSDEVESKIQLALNNGVEIKEGCSMQKMKISWEQYKSIINSFIWKCLHNYRPLSGNEDDSKTILCVDYWMEDNYILGYLGKSLSGYLKNYEKSTYAKISRKNSRDKRQYKRCACCGGLFLSSSPRQKFCSACAKYQPLKEKTITCIDCGKPVLVKSKDNQTNRCEQCYKQYRRLYKSKKEMERRLEATDSVDSTI